MFEDGLNHLFQPFSIFQLQFLYNVCKIAQLLSFLQPILVIPRPLVSYSSSEWTNSTITKVLNICSSTRITSEKKFQKQHNRKQQVKSLQCHCVFQILLQHVRHTDARESNMLASFSLAFTYTPKIINFRGATASTTTCASRQDKKIRFIKKVKHATNANFF